jgi:thiaminase
MTFITAADAAELFWSEIGVADKFKPQHEEFQKFLKSHDNVTYEAAMQQINSLIDSMAPTDSKPRRMLMSQPGAR